MATALSGPSPATQMGSGTRSYYLDRIRVILTVLVVLHHTAITYGAPGGWYYRELKTTLSPAGVLLILFVSVNQAYFMGFFFLLASYFTPASYARKGPRRFLVDRLIRLGIPLAVFGVLLDPLTNAIALAWGQPGEKAQPFWPVLLKRIANRDWHDGPLWFAKALLLFAVAYVIWRMLRPAESRRAPMPTSRAWLPSALGVGAGALLIRQWMPVGKSISDLQLGYFSSYIFLFALGAVAWQRNWLNRLTWRMVRPWAIVSAILLPAVVISAYAAGRLTGKQADFSGGLSIPAIEYAFWEPFVAWGIIASYLVWFRTYANKRSAVWEYLASCAYAVYILHPPFVVGVSMIFRDWDAPALVKFAVTGSLALFATLGASSLLLRIPGVRRVV